MCCLFCVAFRRLPNQEGTINHAREVIKQMYNDLDTSQAPGQKLLKWEAHLARKISLCKKIVKTRRKNGKASIWKLIESESERRETDARIAAEKAAEPAPQRERVVVDSTPEGIVRRMGVEPGKIVIGYMSKAGTGGFVRFARPVHT